MNNSNSNDQIKRSSTQNSSIHNSSSSNIDISSLLNDSFLTSDGNYMPGTASLIDDVDKQLMVLLRDGRTLVGYLRSIDQYANLLLSGTFERINIGKKYGDIPRGVYIIRGENVVLIGEVDLGLPSRVEMIKVEPNEILELQKTERKKQEELEKNKKKSLNERLPQSESLLDEYY